MGVFVFGEFGRNLANRSNQFAATVNHRFEFQKRRQLFIGVHDETLSVQFRQLLKFIETGESGFTSLRAAADLCFLFDVRKS